jgi:hypothetical protein
MLETAVEEEAPLKMDAKDTTVMEMGEMVEFGSMVSLMPEVVEVAEELLLQTNL